MTTMFLRGKLPVALLLAVAGLLTTTASAFCQAPASPAKKVQIKIIVDGKEIDLNEILAAVEAGRKKAPANPAPPTAWIQQQPLLPGQAIPAKPVVPSTPPPGIQARAVHDPRIEELVKQAEAIKPGSGAEIRNALAGARSEMKPAGVAPGQSPYKPDENAGVKLWQIAPTQKDTSNKIVIIMSDADGTVRQLKGDEVELFLKKAGVKDAPSATKPADDEALRKAREDTIKRAAEFLRKQQSSTAPKVEIELTVPRIDAKPLNPADLEKMRKIEKETVTKTLEFLLRIQGAGTNQQFEKAAPEAKKVVDRIVVVPANPAPPQDDLRREVQRLRDELTDLRKRLDGAK